MSNLTNEEKTALAWGSLTVGILFGINTSFVALGFGLLFLSVSQAFGIAIIAFIPAVIVSARWNVRLYRKIKAEKSEAAK